MSPEERDGGYLLDMLHHARGVVRAVEGRGLAEVAADEDLLPPPFPLLPLRALRGEISPFLVDLSPWVASQGGLS